MIEIGVVVFDDLYVGAGGVAENAGEERAIAKRAGSKKRVHRRDQP